MVNFGVVKRSVKDIMANGKRFLYDDKDISKANFVGCVTLVSDKVNTNIYDHVSAGARNPESNFCALSQNGTNAYPTGSRASNAKAHEIEVGEDTYFWFDYR